jgi:predicted methyltransferase
MLFRAIALALPLVLMAAAPAVAHNHGKKKAAAPADPAMTATLDATTSALLDTALAGAHRSADSKARDAARHPKQMLAFAGLRSDMSVIEVSPGGGYWTDILAPVLRDKGTFTLATLNPTAPVGRGFATLVTRLTSTPEVFGNVRVGQYAPSAGLPVGAPNSADLVLVARHMHGLIGRNLAAPALKSWFDVLKPGGVLLIEQHRLPENRPAPTTMTGYVKQSDMIKLAEAAGFRLAATSEINANPKDTADHPFGVWTLPPARWTTANGQGSDPKFDRTKYDAIGESDRMTLKFVKP